MTPRLIKSTEIPDLEFEAPEDHDERKTREDDGEDSYHDNLDAERGERT